MIGRTVWETDVFIELSVDARALYPCLVLRADDDGFFTGAKSVLRLYGLPDEALAELMGAGLLIDLENGVFAITHWPLMNKVQRDRYKRTIHTDKAKRLSGYQEATGSKESMRTFGESEGPYKLLGSEDMDTECIHDVSRMEHKVSKASKDKKEKLSQRKSNEGRIGEFEGKGNPEKSSSTLNRTCPHCGYERAIVNDDGVEVCAKCFEEL
jgi:hypothetical protein